jgi:CTP:molybdopterin cytidylyltransferase MocA
MGLVTLLIFHRPQNVGDPALVRVLADVRQRLIETHSELFRRAGARDVRIVSEWHEGKAFGEVLAAVAPARGGLIVLSSGAVPLLNAADARRLVAVAAAPDRVATTNNRYSSDICAVSNASVLRGLPALPSDNALPRWLEERANYTVSELGGRERLALDLDTPQDVALTALASTAPRWLRSAAAADRLEIPRLDDLRALAADPHRELLVFGRSGSQTLRWLERNVRCRVRFLAEERGMRASSPVAIGGSERSAAQRPPRATLGMLLERDGPSSLARVIASLGDGAIIDSRVLISHRLGADESGWPTAADRFASDLHRHGEIEDPWLRYLTKAAAASPLPILLGGHSLVGPGVRLVLAGTR